MLIKYLTSEYLKSWHTIMDLQFKPCVSVFELNSNRRVLKTKLKWPNVSNVFHQNSSSYITFNTDKLNLKCCTQHTVHVELAYESVANLCLSVPSLHWFRAPGSDLIEAMIPIVSCHTAHTALVQCWSIFCLVLHPTPTLFPHAHLISLILLPSTQCFVNRKFRSFNLV